MSFRAYAIGSTLGPRPRIFKSVVVLRGSPSITSRDWIALDLDETCLIGVLAEFERALVGGDVQRHYLLRHFRTPNILLKMR